MSFVDVYSKTTGRKQTVPEEWLDHPVLGRDFRKTPLSENSAGQGPFGGFTVEQLNEYAAEHHVDVSGLSRKGELIAAITAATTTPPSAGQE